MSLSVNGVTAGLLEMLDKLLLDLSHHGLVVSLFAAGQLQSTVQAYCVRMLSLVEVPRRSKSVLSASLGAFISMQQSALFTSNSDEVEIRVCCNRVQRVRGSNCYCRCVVVVL